MNELAWALPLFYFAGGQNGTSTQQLFSFAQETRVFAGTASLTMGSALYKRSEELCFESPSLFENDSAWKPESFSFCMS